MKFSNRIVKIVLYILMCLVFLYTINEDLFFYYDLYPVDCNFSPDVEEKGDYSLTPEMTLKKGIYELTLVAETQGNGNGYFIKDRNDEILLRESFIPSVRREVIRFEVEKPSATVRMGASYEPSSGEFHVLSIAIKSNHVLTRDSVLRHIVSTLFMVILFSLIGWRLFGAASWSRRFALLADPEQEKIVIYLLALSAITSYPFFYSRMYLHPNDFIFHLLRVEGIKVGLENGFFPVRINSAFMDGYGYGDGLFYPNVFLYFPAVLRLLGFDHLSAYNIFSIATNLIAIFGFYYVTKRISNSRFIALGGVTFFSFASYRLIDFIFRCSLGESLSFIFTPLIILGLYEIFNGHPERWWIFAAGFVGVAWAHLLSLVLSTIATGIFFIYKIREILSNRKILTALIFSVLLVFGLCAFIYLPMAEQALTTKSAANQLISADIRNSDPGTSVTLGSYPFAPTASWGFLLDANLGLPFVVLALLFLFIKKEDKSRNTQLAIFFLVAGLIAVFVSTEWFPWSRLAWLANRLQFAWRILLIAAPLLSLAGGFVFDSLFPSAHRKYALIGLFAFCLVSMGPLYFNAHNVLLSREYPLHLETYRVSGGEYIPSGANIYFIDQNKDTVLSSDPNVLITSHDRKVLRFSFEFERTASAGISESLRFEIPLLFYTGYVVEYEAPGHAAVKLPAYLGEHGLVGVELPEDALSGRVTAFYQATRIQRIGDLITLLTLIGCVVFGVRAWKKKKA